MLNRLTISELTQRSPERRRPRAMRSSLPRQIARIDTQIHAFIRCDGTEALAQAAAADKAIASGSTHAEKPLLGVRRHQDVISVKGQR